MTQLPPHLQKLADAVLGKLEWTDKQKHEGRIFHAIVYLNKESHQVFTDYMAKQLSARYKVNSDHIQFILMEAGTKHIIEHRIKAEPDGDQEAFKLIHTHGAQDLYWERDKP